MSRPADTSPPRPYIPLAIMIAGVLLVGVGLRRARFDVAHMFGFVVDLIWPFFAFLGFAAALAGWSVWNWNQARRSRLTPFALAFAILFVGVAAYSVYAYWPAVAMLFAGDVTDAGRMAALANADLRDAPAVPASPGDWPQWRGPGRDGRSAEKAFRTDWQDGPPATAWRRPLGGGYGSMAVVAGRLYVQDRQGNDERVVCLDTADGHERWSFAYPADYQGIGYGAGPRATPTVHDGLVYTVGATGVFLCLKPATEEGKPPTVTWRHDLVPEFHTTLPQWGMACSPLIEGNLVIVQPGGPEGSVAAFDRRSGALVWRALDDPSGYSSPVAATLAGVRQIVAFTGKGVAGLRAADGRRLWYFDWPEQFEGNIATPIVVGDFVFISSAYNRGGCALLEVHSANGDEEQHVSPVYVKRTKLMRNHHCTCVLHDGCLYGFDNDFLKCVDLRTATEKWVSRDPGKGCLIEADGHLIILTQAGVLAVADAKPEKCTITGRFQVFADAGDVWALPVLSNGRLYLRGKEEIVCLDRRATATK